MFPVIHIGDNDEDAKQKSLPCLSSPGIIGCLLPPPKPQAFDLTRHSQHLTSQLPADSAALCNFLEAAQKLVGPRAGIGQDPLLLVDVQALNSDSASNRVPPKCIPVPEQTPLASIRDDVGDLRVKQVRCPCHPWKNSHCQLAGMELKAILRLIATRGFRNFQYVLKAKKVDDLRIRDERLGIGV